MILEYNGQELATWKVPAAWMPKFGTVLAVPYEGRLTLFRAVGMTPVKIYLDRYSSA